MYLQFHKIINQSDIEFLGLKFPFPEYQDTAELFTSNKKLMVSLLQRNDVSS